MQPECFQAALNDGMKFKVLSDGSITSPIGFVAAGMNAGIKKSFRKLDVSLIYSEARAVSAGMFTTNRVKAWPLLYDLRVIKAKHHRAIFANSGNANCFNGRTGQEAVSVSLNLLSRGLKVPKREVLLASTGVIGRSFPIQKIRKVIPKLIQNLSKAGGHNAACGILTTDTHPKEIAVRFQIDRKPVTIAAMAKGAGMVYPDMNEMGIRKGNSGHHALPACRQARSACRQATMLCFMTTDLNISKPLLGRALSYAVDESFNKIAIDNDRSTNDTVLILANGLAGNRRIVSQDQRFQAFQDALVYLCSSLARSLARDGEGVTHVCEVVVKGAHNRAEAERLCQQISASMLFKTMLAGSDPNWGRIMSSIGASGVVFSPKLNLAFDGVPILLNGREVVHNKGRIRRILRKKEFCLEINLKSGKYQERFWTTDLTKFYVWINSRYST